MKKLSLCLLVCGFLFVALSQAKQPPKGSKQVGGAKTPAGRTTTGKVAIPRPKAITNTTETIAPTTTKSAAPTKKSASLTSNEIRNVPVGEDIYLTKQVSGSTGLSWDIKSIENQENVSAPTSSTAGGSMPGAPAHRIWTFKALKPGITTITLMQSFRGDPQEEYVVQVNIAQ